MIFAFEAGLRFLFSTEPFAVFPARHKWTRISSLDARVLTRLVLRDFEIVFLALGTAKVSDWL